MITDLITEAIPQASDQFAFSRHRHRFLELMVVMSLVVLFGGKLKQNLFQCGLGFLDGAGKSYQFAIEVHCKAVYLAIIGNSCVIHRNILCHNLCHNQKNQEPLVVWL